MAHFVYPVPANAQAATAYPAQAAYVAAAPAQPAYGAATARPGQAYESYPHATTQYAYTTRTPVAVTPAVTYDQPKAYYQPAPAAAAAYTAAETHYQAAKPVFTTGAAGFAAQRPASQPKAQAVQVTTASQSYAYSAASTPAASTYNSAYNVATTQSGISGIHGYDAAVYSAASSYYQQQQAAKAIGTWPAKKSGGQPFKAKPKGPPKTPQLHYCDVCKISCAGPQTYREHLEGQKHKKKEAAAKGTTVLPARSAHHQLKCDLCDVTCTGTDAYAAHIRGAKHQKVVKLHTKLGKPIPSTNPVLMTSSGASTVSVAKTTASTVSVSSGTKVTPKPTTSSVSVVKKVVSTPKITFVGGSTLRTTAVKAEEVKTNTNGDATAKEAETMQTSDDVKEEEHLNILGEKDVTPVGHEYIEEMRNDQGKTVSFNCKLCECKFNDPNAKEMHLKGRRHRLQYKKKVDPNLQVEVKPSIRQRKVQEDKLRRQAQKEEFWRRREQEDRWREEIRMEEEMYWDHHHHHHHHPQHHRRYDMEYFHHGPMGMMGPRGPFMGPRGPGPVMRKLETSDDRHVNAKHTAIYPKEGELHAVQTIVSDCERALKQVSDFLAESDGPKQEPKKDDATPATDGKQTDKEEPASSSRVLKGVMRVGVLAKGLLLHGDLNVNLVVLCSEKPTRTLLERVADSLPKQLATGTEDKYELKRCVEEAAIIVTAEKEPKPSCTITLTSPIMRDANAPNGETVSVKDPPDVLDRQKCLAALAALRHAKWFQARATGLQSCVIVIRILRDLCQRVPTWSYLNQWALELLVEKCVSSGGPNMSPGDALRRVFECISSGLILPGGAGIYDPCEKEPTDALGNLTNQMREDLVASAQHALRLLAFREIHKVLGMDPLPLARFNRQRFSAPRKRKPPSECSEEVAEKREKKDTEETTEAAVVQK